MPADRRFAHVFLPRFQTDNLCRQDPSLLGQPVVTFLKDRNSQFVSSANETAELQGAKAGQPLADLSAVVNDLKTFEINSRSDEAVLDRMADWCVRYTPYTKMNPPDGIWLDISGCAHLLGGEQNLADDIEKRIGHFGYSVRVAIADYPGCAWAVARFAKESCIVPAGETANALADLPIAALRVGLHIENNLKRLGFTRIGDLYKFPRPNLTKRFGKELLYRFDQATGALDEPISPKPYQPRYEERLSFIDTIATREDIEMVATRLISSLCERLNNEQKGARLFWLHCHRVDARIEVAHISTSQPTRSAAHIYRLFFEKFDKIEPGFGIELFVLSAAEVLPLVQSQESFNQGNDGLSAAALAEFVDRINARLKRNQIYRLASHESHWPQKAVQFADPTSQPVAEWPMDKMRPVRLLRWPEPIEVMAPVPDYPPRMFRWRGNTHSIKYAEGPERLEPEWWCFEKEMRDYYRLEDQSGQRFCVYRSGHYTSGSRTNWYLHGFFG